MIMSAITGINLKIPQPVHFTTFPRRLHPASCYLTALPSNLRVKVPFTLYGGTPLPHQL